MIQIETKTNADNNIITHFSLDGETNQMIHELAAGAAYGIVSLAGCLATMDDLHESLATVVCSEILSIVRSMQKEIEEEAERDMAHRMGDGTAEERMENK